MQESLRINNLTVSFETPEGRLTAVKDVSLKLAGGETLALVGESGCGKTVLCKSMLKVLCSRGVIDKGEILLGSKELTAASEREMRDCRGSDIAMVFQDPMTSLDPAFSVGEQIAEALKLHGGLSAKSAKGRALELMQLVSIPEAEKRYSQRPYQFSGGMRQRIAIAIALAGEPDVLLADEPTTALDEQTQEDILRLLKDIQRRTGVAILFITHDLSLVEDIADRVAIMKDGRLVEEGSVREVFRDPQHPYTKKLLGYLDYKKNRGHDHRRAATAELQLSVRNLCKSYKLGKGGINSVLEDFSMDIYKGEIVGIVGRSGCGKSTLARCIMGIDKPDSGVIDVNGSVDIQMIFQDSQSAFNDRMTVRQIIEEPLVIGGLFTDPARGGCKEPSGRQRRIKGGFGAAAACGYKAESRRRAVEEAMMKVELDTALAARKPYELSGGQRQRVAIARALITEPDLIIADEPLTGLDVSAQAQIVHLFRRLTDEQGLTIMFIAHDLPMVNHISSRIIRM